MNKRTSIAIIVLAGGLACFGWALRSVGLTEVLSAVTRAGPLLPLAFLPYGISLAVDGWAFARMLRRIGVRAHPLRLAAARLSSEALALSLPGGALLVDTVNPVLLRERCGIRLELGIGGMAARKCLIVCGHGVYLGLAALLGWGFLAGRSRSLVHSDDLPWVVLGVAAAILVAAGFLLLALVGGAPAARLASVAACVPIRRLRSWLAAANDGFARTDTSVREMLTLRSGAGSLPGFVLMWCCEALESWVLLTLLGFEVGFTEALAIEATVSVVRALAFFAPAGLGFQEAGYLALLGSNGPGAAAATAFVFVKRLRELSWIAIGYLLLGGGRRHLSVEAGASDHQV